MSIHSSTFPKLWKMGKITPLFKKGSTQDPGNYRPISILPVLSKLLEKHVAIHLLEFLNSHDLLHSQQSGFRAKHSCETALHYMLNDWLSSAHANELVGVMFIDFCKAFDLVDHKLLLEKLKLYKFSQSALHWFTCYLTERQQCVKVNSILSEKLQCKSGVPQGSVLGPILFLIYINDLPFHPSLERTSLFADDATNTASAKSLNIVKTKLQSNADNLLNWCKNNRMVLNVDKTKVMVISPNLRRNIDETNIEINLSDRTICQVAEEKLLGVQIDHALSWNSQVQKQKKTIIFKLFLLKRIRKFLPLETRKLFYNYYVKPHFEYCNTIWGNCSKTNIYTMTKLQKQAARLILNEQMNKENTTPSTVLFQTLDWQTFEENVKYRQALLVYKALNNGAPGYMKDMFNYIHQILTQTLRSSTENKLYLQKVHTKSIKYTGPRIWNALNKEIRNAKSVKDFKDLYHRHSSQINQTKQATH